MRHTPYIRIFFTLIIAALICPSDFSQNCTVEKASLKGTYTGDCKRGKASGKGKAIGTDTYEGEFKAGMPDGQGTYTWSNGDSYTGKFSKGQREGKGIMTVKNQDGAASYLDGFWEKDEFIGKNEHPYIVHYTSRLVVTVDVKFKRDAFKQINFLVSNTLGGAGIMRTDSARRAGGGNPNNALFGGQANGVTKMKIDDIALTLGNYTRMTQNQDHAKKSETILYDVAYPARMKLTISSELVEIEFLEAGSYEVSIEING